MTDSELPAVRLLPGRERPLDGGHPWIFSRAVDERTTAGLPSGALVRLEDAAGEPHGLAFFSATSSIRLRRIDAGAAILTDEGLRAHLERLQAWKRAAMAVPTDAMRLVHGEADGLPGLVIDRYGDVAVLQLSIPGMDLLRERLTAALVAFGIPTVYERSDVPSRSYEGLEPRTGLLAGTLPKELVIEEDGAKLVVDVLRGQKTGFFLDQRTARTELVRHAKEKRLLNVFSYTGAFTIRAVLAGAVSSTNVDVSNAALDGLKRNLELNGIDDEEHKCIPLEAARALKSLRDQKARYDLVVVDPPAFVKKRDDLASGTRAYVKTFAHAMRLAEPGAIMLASSCSHFVTEEHFGTMLRDAAKEAHRTISVLSRVQQAHDHTMTPFFPEGQYLKSWFLVIH